MMTKTLPLSFKTNYVLLITCHPLLKSLSLKSAARKVRKLRNHTSGSGQLNSVVDFMPKRDGHADKYSTMRWDAAQRTESFSSWMRMDLRHGIPRWDSKSVFGPLALFGIERCARGMQGRACTHIM
jgi:hypothetical protein